MSAEEWELSPYLVAECPRCGNRTVQSEVAWVSQDDYAAVPDEDGEPDYIEVTNYWHFMRCVTCDGAAVYEEGDPGDLSAAKLVWPVRAAWPTSPNYDEMAQHHLAAAADLLSVRGHQQALALLLEVDAIAYPGREGPDGYFSTDAVLSVPAAYVDRFDESVRSDIAEAMTEAGTADRVLVWSVEVAVAAPKGDWRERAEHDLGLQESNTAVLLPNRAARPIADGLTFGSTEEVIVWETLKVKQAELPNDETIAIIPNCTLRVANGSHWAPDFVVTFRGRVDGIEVDSHHHRGRYAADASRDEVLRDSGIHVIYRIPVEAVSDRGELARHIDRFLKRVAER